MNGREETAAVVAGAAAGALRAREHDVAGQIGSLAAETVEGPRAEARAAELLRAGVHQNLRGRVVDGVGLHRAHEAKVIDDFRGVRQEFAELDTALAVG